MAECRILGASDLRVGLTAEFERDITEEDVFAFATLSGDRNPLHVDAAYARETNYEKRIVHGAFQVGLASAMAGMYLPGRNTLLGAIRARFTEPLYFPCRVRVNGQITSWDSSSLRGSLHVRVSDVDTGSQASQIYADFTLHSKRLSPKRSGATRRSGNGERNVVLVTGASGGIGESLVSSLAESFDVLAMSRRNRLKKSLREMGNVEELNCNLSSSSWEDMVTAALTGRPLYGIVHAAWPGAPHGGLLELPIEVIEQQLTFGALRTVQLARYIYRHANETGRIVVLGTVFSTLKPVLSLSAYSLGKTASEHVVRLLAPELARRNITINAVLPSLVAVGINKNLGERQLLREAAKVPAGRLCAPADVCHSVLYLLSPDTSFVSGQCLALTGGQL